MKLATITLLAVLLSEPMLHARIGDTIGQAITRNGAPKTSGEKDAQDPTVSIYRWQREDRLITIRFAKGIAVEETYTNFQPSEYPKLIEASVSMKLTPAQVAAINTEPGSYDLPGVHVEIDSRLILTPAAEQPRRFPPIQVRDNQPPEIKEATAMLAQMEAYDAKLKAIEATDRAAGLYHVRGSIISSYPDGYLLQTSGAAGLGSRVFITGLQMQPPLLDGTRIGVRAKISGTFQYRAIDAGTHTINKLAYDSEIPLP